MRDDGSLGDDVLTGGTGSARQPARRFYDPAAPLDKALPEAIAEFGLKRQPEGADTDEVPGSVVGHLVAELALPRDVLRAAGNAATRNGTDLGRELVASRAIGEDALAAAIGAVLGFPVEGLEGRDRIIGDSGPAMPDAPRMRFLKTCDGRLQPKLFLAPRIEHLDETRRFFERHAGRRAMVRIATPGALAAHRAAASAERRAEAARLSLSRDQPALSARNVLTGLQGMVVAALLLSALLVAVLRPGLFFPLLHMVAIPLFLGSVWLRLAAATLPARALPPPDSAKAEESDGQHPDYSILVALHRESEVVPDLVQALAALDWPRARLEVMLVCEGDDPETIATARAACEQEPGFSVVVVPPSLPRTKPKALNFALPLATGEFVALYDAEDRPRRDQLQAAWRAMRQGGERLACVQAPLVVENHGRNWLTGHFALEYAALFRGLLPFLARFGLPMPLGGTSNHFRRSALEEVGGWDSHNVTEDADLGIRLARRGYAIGTIEPPTVEEAPERWTDWRNQRTRWMKGWMQTYLVHMRHPLRLARDLGPAGFAAFQLLFFGMIASTLAQPFFLGFLGYTIVSLNGGDAPDALTIVLATVDLFNLVVGYLAFALLATRRLDAAEATSLPRRLWSLHAYWFLVSLASARAFSQLLRAPHLWEKTPHGSAARAGRRSTPT